MIKYHMSLRADGNMKLSNNRLDNDDVPHNRIKFLEKHSIYPQSVVSADLEHGNTVRIVTVADLGKVIPKCDGLITFEKNIFLSITVADCLPIVIFNQKKDMLCLLHAGWRGLNNKIISKALATLQNIYNIDPTELLVSIGPAIGPCHYEVNTDLAEKFSQYSNVAIERDSKVFLDLKKIAQKQLMELGILLRNITTSDICTFCQSDIYFSHRKDQSNPVQAMMVVAGIL